MAPPTEVGALALGGNLGDPRAAMACALTAIGAATGGLLAVSRAYLTRAQSLPRACASAGQDPDYWNAVCLVRPRGSPEAMLATCQALEWAAGRRPGRRWGPRPLDIDMLFWGEARRDGPELTLPHPRLAVRPFVLWPLAEVALDLPLPIAVPLGGAAGATPRQLLMAQKDPLSGILEVHAWAPPSTLDVSRRCS